MNSGRKDLNIQEFFFYCVNALSLQLNRTQGSWVTSCSSQQLIKIWSGLHEMGHIISQTCIIIICNNGVYPCEAITKLHWKMHRMCC